MEAGIRKEDVTCLADIKKLPIITKNMIRKNTENILTIPQRKALNGFTSGTTGTPLKVYKDWENPYGEDKRFFMSSEANMDLSTGNHLFRSEEI